MKAVIFDLFGTLLQIPRTTSPYLQLFASARAGVDPKQLALTRNLPLSGLARELGSPLPASRLAELDAIVAQEAKSAVLYADTTQALQRVRDSGARVIVSSNLAAPYGAVRHLLDGLVDYWCLSFVMGVRKPDARMFTTPAQFFGIKPQDCVVVGDSFTSDCCGAAAAGMRSVLLDRTGRHAALGKQPGNLHEATQQALSLLEQEPAQQQSTLRVQVIELTEQQRQLLTVTRPVVIPGRA